MHFSADFRSFKCCSRHMLQKIVPISNVQSFQFDFSVPVYDGDIMKNAFQLKQFIQ